MHWRISWSLIIGLLFLRIPFLGFMEWLAPVPWVDIVFQIGTYLLTALFLFWECKNLPDYHVDILALWIIVLFKPLQTLILRLWDVHNPLAFPNIPSLLIWLIAFGLAFALWSRSQELPKFRWNSLGWLGIGVLVGIGTALLLAVPMSFQAGSGVSLSIFWSALKSQALLGYLYQIGYAALSEEPLFRGFLWGALRKAGWREVWIWLFQAALFVLGHIFYINKFPISFFIIVPVSTLILGLLVWKARTISASMAAHAAVNDLGFLLGNLAAHYIR